MKNIIQSQQIPRILVARRSRKEPIWDMHVDGYDYLPSQLEYQKAEKLRVPWNLENTTPKRLAEDAKKMQHIANCHRLSTLGRKHPQIWPIAAATAIEERARAAPEGMASPADDTGAICMAWEACACISRESNEGEVEAALTGCLVSSAIRIERIWLRGWGGHSGEQCGGRVQWDITIYLSCLAGVN